MKKPRELNAGVALRTLTAAAALLAGMPVADTQAAGIDDATSGQAAPGSGSFPGSFLVPGTNTSIKIGGYAKGVIIYDAGAMGSSDPDTLAVFGIPLEGSAAHQLHGNTRLHARQSQFSFDVRTPTAWGELDTSILTDFFGQNTSQVYSGSNTQNARLVLAYGTLGPVLVGQFLTVFFDGQAIGESVDPTTSIGVNNGFTNRQPQFRYTYVAADGLSFAISAEQPDWEVVAADGTGNQAQGGSITGTQVNGGNLTNKYPDFLGKVQWDQSWGHLAGAFVIRQQEPRGVGIVRFSKTGWGLNLSAHVNTFGKDTLRGGVIVGQAIGHYLSQMGAAAGVQATSLTNATNFQASTPFAIGVHLDYTHWWTNELRSTFMAGYEHLDMNQNIFVGAGNAVTNGLDKQHIATTINLIWSPVPQVDFGIEYDWAQRKTQRPLAGTTNTDTGFANRIEGMGVFKF